ncbi:MAG: hypothetical protein UV54_C0025G0003 [Candidatus Beckwithbacteria bacterium GW2011_GWA2_43_10]|uniref:Translation elongation factor-like protein n=1 Tax=Candidatus Beckwithbacteria bacterium GW2011_GWA2_43_10 TaxID=1618369 RepID=A0A0G1EA17_9BACT|nr:MAG: hypothetical protein UV54_C0025G0003 [Candidatus Beckwithbacteria bacterium GW2011_GWA2_43_10]
MGKFIGKVAHYFDKAMVIVVKLEDSLSIGDTIKLKKGEEEFDQLVDSIQIEHKNIEKAKKGDEVAIKISRPAKQGAEVYRL